MFDIIAYNTSFDRSNVINFNVKHLSATSSVTVYYGDNSTQFTSNNETLTVTSDYFYIEAIDNGNDGFLMEYTLKSDINPKYRTFTFNDTNPHYIMSIDDIKVNDTLVFCSNVENDTEVFITDKVYDSFYVYDSPVGSQVNFEICKQFLPSNTATIPSSILSNKGCLAIYRWENSSSSALIFARSRSSIASDAQYWMNFGIFAYGLVVTVPVNNSLTLTGSIQMGPFTIAKNGCQHIQKGVMISPSLNGLNYASLENTILYQSKFVQENTMNFTVEMLSGNEIVKLFSGSFFTSLSQGEIISVVEKSFNLSVSNISTSLSDGFIIKYTLISNVNPNYNYIDLDESNPYYLTQLDDIPVNNGTVVCGLPDDVDIHLTDGQYDSFCLFPSNFEALSSKSGCFHLYRANEGTSPVTVLIRSIETQAKNCENGNNIFEASDTLSSAMATSKGNGSCEMILLASQYDPLTSIFINKIEGINSDSLILKSAVNNNKIAEIPSADTKNWLNFGMYSLALTAVIPEGNTVILSTNVQRNITNLQKDRCQHIQKGVLVSPGYTGTEFSNRAEDIYDIAFVQINLIEFKVIKMSDTDIVTIFYDEVLEHT
uniref:IgGFc-binding protein N-terminal domain-containing protein n=1 Tax=Panagrolaimus superbus TaxID=310955 RepID=A0A914YTJ4_9BILA